MWEFANIFPDAEVLLALEPEELGAKMLFLLQKRQPTYGLMPKAGLPVFNYEYGQVNDSENSFHPQHLIAELWPDTTAPNSQTTYPSERRGEVELAETEALAWLESQALIIPTSGANGQNGWRRLSRRARRFQSETEFVRYTVARRLPKDALNQRIADKVWMAFMRGEFDVAAFQAMKAVEVAVREASGRSEGIIGTKLMQEAFRDNGPLADMTGEASERQGLIQLFIGAIGCYKNPHSHRDVDLNDPTEAVEIILLANHLLRIADARLEARAATS